MTQSRDRIRTTSFHGECVVNVFPRVATDEIFLKHFPRVDRSQRKLGEDDEHAVRDVPARYGGGLSGRESGPVTSFTAVLRLGTASA